jgi:hypothetical protein
LDLDWTGLDWTGFRLGPTIMNALVQNALPEHALTRMSFFLKYLEEKWSIKKRNDVYILKQKDGTRCIYTPSYLAIAVTSLDFNSGFHSDNEIKRTQLLTFLHNALEGGWNIKKQSSMANTSASNTYVFVKKHNGQYKMYEDDEYLTQFMKNNLSLEA